jgi:hypothetical protein
MPDFERPIRDMRLHLAKTEQERAVIAAYHRGQDHARREIAIIALIAAILTIVICVVIS